MKIESLELQNFCQHRRLELAAGNGLIAIVGPNGSGKSNLLGAVRLALTGENPNAGKKADNVSQFAQRGERSYVKLRFSHGGVTATVTRNLNPATPAAMLEEAGKPAISGDTLVTARICEILGVSVEVINDIVIVAQDDIFGFLEKTPTKRAEQFQRLFRTDAAAPLYEFLNKQANRMASVTSPYTPEQITAMRTELAAADARVLETAAVLAASPTLADCDSAVSRWEAVAAEAAAAARLQAEHTATREQLERVKADITALEENHTRWQKRVDDLTATVEAKYADEVAAQATLAAADVYTRHAASVAAATQQQAQLIRQREALVPPPVPAGYPDENADQQLADLEAVWRNADAQHTVLCRALAETIARCPTCHVAVDPRLRFEESGITLGLRHGGDVAAEIARVVALVPVTEADVRTLTQQRDEMGESLNRLAPQLGAAREKARAFRTYEAVLRPYQQRVQDLTTRHDQISQQLQQLGNVAPPAGDHATAAATCRAAVQARTDLSAANGMLTSAANTLNNLRGRKAALQDAADKQAAQVAAIPGDLAANGHTAGEALAAWKRQRDMRRGDEQVMASLTSGRAQLQEKLRLAEEMAAKAAESLACRDYISAMAALVHCNAAPRFVAQQNLQQLQRAVNEYLAMFQAEFRVVADEGLSFTANFNDGVRRQPAERLSGGQKVVLALAFRLATNLQLAAGIGGLYLDEPTAYLDKTHIRGFEPALARLRQFCTSRGFQCVIVTHETGLAPLFDSVIDLGATAA